jgi:hypothetical protein
MTAPESLHRSYHTPQSESEQAEYETVDDFGLRYIRWRRKLGKLQSSNISPPFDLHSQCTTSASTSSDDLSNVRPDTTNHLANSTLLSSVETSLCDAIAYAATRSEYEVPIWEQISKTEPPLGLPTGRLLNAAVKCREMLGITGEWALDMTNFKNNRHNHDTPFARILRDSGRDFIRQCNNDI